MQMVLKQTPSFNAPFWFVCKLSFIMRNYCQTPQLEVKIKIKIKIKSAQLPGFREPGESLLISFTI